MAIRIVENFDDNVALEPESHSILANLLRDKTFLQQVAQELQCDRVEFTNLLFQPVPYSPRTPRGMPAKFEPYYTSPDYVILNVPPNFMFKAKIFAPPRLCAIYRKFMH